MCARCAGWPCQMCGTWINAKAGSRSPTCSVICRKKRASERELERYNAVKNTAGRREVRQAYISKLKSRISNEPGFAAIYRAFIRQYQRDHMTRINANPARRAELLKSKRAISAAWREALRSDPSAYAAHLHAAREWYASLSKTEKDRIYNRSRK